MEDSNKLQCIAYIDYGSGKLVFYMVDIFFPVLQAAFLFTVVGTTGFLGIIAGQLPGVTTNCLFINEYEFFHCVKKKAN